VEVYRYSWILITGCYSTRASLETGYLTARRASPLNPEYADQNEHVDATQPAIVQANLKMTKFELLNSLSCAANICAMRLRLIRSP